MKESYIYLNMKNKSIKYLIFIMIIIGIFFIALKIIYYFQFLSLTNTYKGNQVKIGLIDTGINDKLFDKNSIYNGILFRYFLQYGI